MLASMLAAQAMLLVSGACVDGTVGTCSLGGCYKAQKECFGTSWGPCECVSVCAPGQTAACTPGTGCLYSQKTCAPNGQWAPCACVCADDTNVCTADSWTGTQCLHQPLTSGCCASGTPVTSACCDAGVQKAVGFSCSDGNQCNGAETCDAYAQCIAGTPPFIDDSNHCTLDRCDPATGAVTHVTGDSACTSATFYCHDKYGNVTKKAVCVAGVPCDSGCP